MYSFDGKVRYSECDENGDLTLLSLINYLQDSSTFHSESIGLGIEYMRERGLGWLIAAWQIEIDHLPHFCDEFRVNTWCPGMARTTVTRDFVICDPKGAQLVRAESLWFVYSFAEGRPIRIPQDQHVYLTGEEPLDMPPTKRRLSIEGPAQAAPPITVGELHLDSNRHVNNAQYLGMATNALVSLFGNEGTVTPHDIRRLCVQYKRQALLGDVIVPQVHVNGTRCTVNLADPNGATYAVVQIDR